MELNQRNLQPELMDDPNLDASLHEHALTGLRTVNRWSRTDAAIWSAVDSYLLQQREQRDPAVLRVLDIACGGGDQALRLGRRMRAAGIPGEVHGCDISPTAVRFATKQASSESAANVRFFVSDVFNTPLPQDTYDVVMCSLFLHHLTELQAVQLLEMMYRAARQLVIVDDLQRTLSGYWLAWIGCRILSRSQIVHCDGPMSVQGAFTISEAVALAKKAGWVNPAIQTHWPQRFLLTGRTSK